MASKAKWESAPRSIRMVLIAPHDRLETQQRQAEALGCRLKQLEGRLGYYFSNSDNPPSSDSPFKKREVLKAKASLGQEGGHRGHRFGVLWRKRS